MEFVSYTPDQAFIEMIHVLQGIRGEHKIRRQDSRNGKVIRVIEPVTIQHRNPLNRVLFNPERDCNPFFHLFEAMWMLAGRNDLAPLQYFVSTFGQFSDDGKTLNGAYGYRWRQAEGSHEVIKEDYEGLGTVPGIEVDRVDQLNIIIEELRNNPDSRRCVLQMWNVRDDLMKIGKSADVCCNTNCYFFITDGELDMTVCNRSNDMVLGMLGANLVHFSFLQEYMANCIGIPVGVFYQTTNNLHAYSWNWEPEDWLLGNTNVPSFYPKFGHIPLVKDKEAFDEEVVIMVDFPEATLHNTPEDMEGCPCSEPFLEKVIHPACVSFMYHKERNYPKAFEWAEKIEQVDWQIACRNWLTKRENNWLKKQAEEVNE